MRRAVGFLGCSFVLFVTGSACDDEKAVTCKADEDCPEGELCREERCSRSDEPNGASDVDAGGTCTLDDSPCLSPDECCSRSCNAGWCGTPGAPTDPACRGLYELCQNDCCAGLTCRSGTCH